MSQAVNSGPKPVLYVRLLCLFAEHIIVLHWNFLFIKVLQRSLPDSRQFIRHCVAIREMLLARDLCGKSGGVLLSSILDRGVTYEDQVQRLGERRVHSCRAVLILTALLSVFMPVTEHFCRWDRFLQGGSDLEFGVLCLLLFAGLILLIAHQAATSPFQPLLLAYRLIAFPLRCLLTPARPLLALSLAVAGCSRGAPFVSSYIPGTTLPGTGTAETPLRI